MDRTQITAPAWSHTGVSIHTAHWRCTSNRGLIYTCTHTSLLFICSSLASPDNIISLFTNVKFWALQGSALCTLPLSLYISLFGQRICSHGTHFHCQPDDTWAVSQRAPIKADDRSQTTNLEVRDFPTSEFWQTWDVGQLDILVRWQVVKV